MALLTFAGIPAAQCADAHPKRHRQQPPNIVLIHLDDMGYGDLTATGATGYRTPNIDRLCAEGMRFTNYYSAQAVSSASRAGQKKKFLFIVLRWVERNFVKCVKYRRKNCEKQPTDIP